MVTDIIKKKESTNNPSFVVSTFSVKYVNQFDRRNGSERLTYTKERVLG